MVSDEDQAARRRPRRKATEVADERLPGAEVEAAPGSSRISRSGSGIRARAIWTRRFSPVDSVPNAWSWRAPAPISSRSSRARSRSAVVGVPPRSEGGVPGGDHDVEGRQARVDRRLEAGARVADLAPEVAGVDPADRLAEDFDRAGRRPEIGARDVDERRLARSVRAEDDPALAVADGPVDRPRIVRPERRTETPVNRRITLAMLPGPIAGLPLMRVPGIRAFAPTQPAATTGLIFPLRASRPAVELRLSGRRSARGHPSRRRRGAPTLREPGLPCASHASRASSGVTVIKRTSSPGRSWPSIGWSARRRPRRLDSRRSSGDQREGSTACRRAELDRAPNDTMGQQLARAGPGRSARAGRSSRRPTRSLSGRTRHCPSTRASVSALGPGTMRSVLGRSEFARLASGSPSIHGQAQSRGSTPPRARSVAKPQGTALDAAELRAEQRRRRPENRRYVDPAG